MSNLVLSFKDTRELGLKIARGIKAEYETISLEKFPDGEFNISINKNPKNKTVIIISSMGNSPNQKMIQTILTGGIAKDFGAKKIILFATYFPYLRQDTHFFKYDSFSSRYITKLFEGFDKVITIDPHLHRIKNLKVLSSKLTHITINPLIAKYIKKRFKNKFTIIGPDEESAQWSRPIAKMLDKDVVVLKKHRYSSTKIKVREIEGFQGSNEEEFEKNVIIIDDIISTGRTISGALSLAKKEGAKKLFCIGIHGLLINNSIDLIKKHGELITSNTIPSKFSKIDVSPAVIKELKKFI